jgi:hypothetical protein
MDHGTAHALAAPHVSSHKQIPPELSCPARYSSLSLSLSLSLCVYVCVQPFFRAHAHHDSKRREPWLFGEPHTSHLRKAVLARFYYTLPKVLMSSSSKMCTFGCSFRAFVFVGRYALLPYFYTLFDTHQETGRAVMLPLWYLYPQDQSTFAMEDQV